MTAMLKLEEAIARGTASGAKDGGERSCSIISLKEGRPANAPGRIRKSQNEYRARASTNFARPVIRGR